MLYECIDNEIKKKSLTKSGSLWTKKRQEETSRLWKKRAMLALYCSTASSTNDPFGIDRNISLIATALKFGRNQRKCPFSIQSGLTIFFTCRLDDYDFV